MGMARSCSDSGIPSCTAPSAHLHQFATQWTCLGARKVWLNTSNVVSATVLILYTAFGGYLGHDTSKWAQYDACALAKEYGGPARHLLLDTGTADSFLEVQLKPERLVEAVAGNGNLTVTSRLQEGYDHSYFFIATFMDDHVDHAAKHLM